jgi:hypothetical protein
MINVGGKLYYVERINNAFRRKKEIKIIDGETWYKHDKPIFEYEITEGTVLGVLVPTITGVWPENEDGIMDRSMKFNVLFDGRKISEIIHEDEIYIDDEISRQWETIFLTKEQAENYIKERIEERDDVDT